MWTNELPPRNPSPLLNQRKSLFMTIILIPGGNTWVQVTLEGYLAVDNWIELNISQTHFGYSSKTVFTASEHGLLLFCQLVNRFIHTSSTDTCYEAVSALEDAIIYRIKHKQLGGSNCRFSYTLDMHENFLFISIFLKC